MNILFLLRLWPVYGGGETVTICLANEMIRRGYQVSVAYFKDSVKDNIPYIDPKINQIRIENVKCDEFSVDQKSAMFIQDRAIQIINENRIDVVINQWWPVCYISQLGSKTKARIITCLHQAFYTPIMDEKGMRGLVKKMFRGLYEDRKKRHAVKNVQQFLPFVDKYVFLSSSFKEQYQEFSHDADLSKKLYAIPNPLVYSVDTVEVENFSKENVVLLVGRMLEGQKRISKAIAVWEQIEKDERFNDWRFEIVGEGPDLVKYKLMASSKGLSRVFFEGFQPPLEYYKRAKIFMMTSAFEGFPMTLVEAQQCGVVPIVLDTFLSLHDIVQSGVNGLTVPNNGISEFVKTLKGIMLNKDKRRMMSTNAVNSCKRFSVSAVVDEWETMIKTI